MTHADAPTSLADIALRRARRDATTPLLLTIDEQEHAQSGVGNVRVLTYG